MFRILTLFILTSLHLSASPIPDFPFTAVYGTATKEVVPDKATISFTVLTHDQKSEVAVANLNKVLSELVDGMVKLGVPKEAFVADDLSKEAVRERDGNHNRLKILGYNVSRRVKVSVDKIDHYTAVIRLIMNTDNITSVSSDFDISARDKVETELMASACADARKRAELLCKGIGVELGDVFAISEQNFTGLSGRFGFGYNGNIHASGGSLLPGIAGNDEVPVFVPAKIEVQASVNVLYRLGAVKKEK